MRVFSTNVIKMPKVKPPRVDLRHNSKPKGKGNLSPDIKEPETPTEQLHALASFLTDDNTELVNADYFLADRQAQSLVQLETPKSLSKNELRLQKIRTPQIKVTFDSSKWVFTQATAVASVNVLDFPKWQITTDTIKYVNSNGNAWTSDMIKNTYKSFQGAMNLKDHIAPEDGGLIYGIIIDAVLRKIPIGNSFIYYVDTLIATHKETDSNWANYIKDSKIRYLSVGFDCDFVQCSCCGHIYSADGTGACQHQLDRGKIFYDAKGRKSIIAEVPTTADGVGLAFFAELSYLSVNPAFEGATQGYIFDIADNKSVSVVMDTDTLLREAMIHFENEYKVLEYGNVIP